MDKLVEVLAEKKAVTLSIIITLLPGIFLIYVWNKNIFHELDIFKLLLLDASITIVTWICSLVLIIGVVAAKEDITKKKLFVYVKDKEGGEIYLFCLLAMLVTNMLLIILIFRKVLVPSTSMRWVFEESYKLGVFIIIVTGAIEIIASAIRLVKKIYKKVKSK